MVAAISAISLGISRFIVARDELFGVETSETEHHRWLLAIHAGLARRCKWCDAPTPIDDLTAGACHTCAGEKISHSSPISVQQVRTTCMTHTQHNTRVEIGSRWHLPLRTPQMVLQRRPWVARQEGVYRVIRRDLCHIGEREFPQIILQLDDGKPAGDYEALYAYVAESDLLSNGEQLA